MSVDAEHRDRSMTLPALLCRPHRWRSWWQAYSTITPGAAHDAAMLAHPAGRARSIGYQMIELAPAVTEEQLTGFPPEPHRVTLRPPVRVLECQGCGMLARIGSPHLLAHHQTHRARPWRRRVRARLYRAWHRIAPSPPEN